MKTFAIITAFLAGALAAPATTIPTQESRGPALTEIQYRVSNLENASDPRWVDTVQEINGAARNWDESDKLVGACSHCLNLDGHVRSTRIDILTPLNAVQCKLYNGDKHVIQEFNNLRQGADFDGIEEPGFNKATNADKYSLLCYYV